MVRIKPKANDDIITSMFGLEPSWGRRYCWEPARLIASNKSGTMRLLLPLLQKRKDQSRQKRKATATRKAGINICPRHSPKRIILWCLTNPWPNAFTTVIGIELTASSRFAQWSINWPGQPIACKGIKPGLMRYDCLPRFAAD